MKKILLLVSLLTILIATAQPQDSLFVWKSGLLVNKQSIKPADMDSITFKRPTTIGINIAGPNITDIDGNVYASVTNCGQTWIQRNLNVSRYSDGTPIPQVTSPTDWTNLTTGAWCYYANNTANGSIYGKLYNWYAVAGIYDAASAANPALRKKLAPIGWHVPSDGEWSNLINCLDPNADGGNTYPNIAGGKMKATGTIEAGTGLWASPNTDATNESGFTGLSGGWRWSGFASIGNYSNWWSSTEFASTDAWSWIITNNTGTVNRGQDFTLKLFGLSVRCVRD